MNFNQIMQAVSQLAILLNVAFAAFVAATPADHPLPWWFVPAVAVSNAVIHALPSAGIVMPSPPVVKALVIASLLAVGLSACTRELGYAGAHPGAIECRGKASLSFQGSGVAAAGIGGTEVNAGSVTFDCGDAGAYLKQGMPTITDTSAAAVVSKP